MNGKFHGTRAVTNVWKPYVQTSLEFSLAQIWVVADIPYTELNTIEAGWQVLVHFAAASLYIHMCIILFIYLVSHSYYLGISKSLW